MECQSKKCKKTRRKDHVYFFYDLCHVCSESSLSTNSESLLCPFKLKTNRGKREKEGGQGSHKRDYLTRIFEKKKLKEKSLSKKMRTPLDRKLYRTCWPIQLGKVSKIKKKPTEKRKGKPNHKSLRKKKFPNPTFITSEVKSIRRRSPSLSSCGSDIPEDFSNRANHNFKTDHFLHEPVTPQMLIDVLQDPEHLKSGANIDMIITKLRTLKLDLNPSEELLREEVFRKLCYTMKLGLVKEKNGYYRIADNYQMNKVNRKKLNAFWDAYNRKLRNTWEHRILK